MDEVQKVCAPHVVHGHLVTAAIAGHLDEQREAEAAIGRILAIDPTYGDHVVADLERRNLHPDLIRILLDGLRRAGLRGRDVAAAAAPRRLREMPLSLGQGR